MIKGTAQLGKTDDITMTVTLTMTVQEAREIANQQPDRWPGCELARVLNRLLSSTVERVEREHASEPG